MPKVVVIDRDLPRREVVAKTIAELAGLAIEQAEKDLTTLRRFRQAPPDLIFLGIDNPDDWILAGLLAAFPAIPVIAYTDRYEPAIMQKVVTMGARDLLTARSGRVAMLSAILAALREKAA
jgi:AmiR/NasT family two-component response regulator